MADIRINAIATTATDFASDDYIAIDGTANGTRKVNAKTANLTFGDVRFGTSGPSAKSSIAARAARQGLVFDGTGGAPTFTAASIGSGDFTAAAFITATSFGSNGRVILNGTSFEFGLLNTGAIYIYNGTTVLSSTGTLTAGKSTLVTYTKSGTSGTFYINGVSAGTVADSSTYGSVSGVGGNNSVSGMLGTIAPYLENRALSAAEVVSLYEAGVPSGGDYATPAATNTNQITGDAWYTLKTGTVSSGTITIGVGQYVGRDNTLTKGKRYRTTYNVTALSGTVIVGNTSASPQVAQNLSLGAGSFEFTAGDSNAFAFSSNGGTATINSVTFISVGLLLAPDAAQAGGGLTWYDTSGNAANITLPASGVTWNVPTSGKMATSLTVNGGALTVNNLGASSAVINATQSASTGYSYLELKNTGGTAQTWQLGLGGSGIGGLAQQIYAYDQTANAVRFSVSTSGNLLLKSDGVDSANGKLQLATHTTSAGGIGFGTDTSLYRYQAGGLALDASNNVPAIMLRQSGVNAAYFYTSSLVGVLGTSGAYNLLLQTNGTTALTLSGSDQSATFAGTISTATNAAKNAIVARYNSANSLFGVTVNSAGQSVLSENTDASTGSDAYSKTGLPAFRLGNTGGSGTVPFWIDVAASGTAGGAITWTNAFKIDASKNSTFAGTVSPQQAATASAPTYVKGAIYFDTTLNKLRVGGATGWETITSV